MKLIKRFIAWRDRRYLRRQIKEAKRLHSKTGKQYHVMPVDNGKLLVVDNDWMRSYNRQNKTSRLFNGVGRRKAAVYSTPIDNLDERLRKLKLI